MDGFDGTPDGGQRGGAGMGSGAPEPPDGMDGTGAPEPPEDASADNAAPEDEGAAPDAPEPPEDADGAAAPAGQEGQDGAGAQNGQPEPPDGTVGSTASSVGEASTEFYMQDKVNAFSGVAAAA